MEKGAEGKICSFLGEAGKQEGDPCRMLETKDRQMQDSLIYRDQAWLNSLHSCNESLRFRASSHKDFSTTNSSGFTSDF